MGGCTGDENISNLFNDKCSSLYNKQEMQGICIEINGRLSVEKYISELSVDDAMKSVKKLQHSKSDD